jgi:hypothetical protein
LVVFKKGRFLFLFFFLFAPACHFKTPSFISGAIPFGRPLKLNLKQF